MTTITTRYVLVEFTSGREGDEPKQAYQVIQDVTQVIDHIETLMMYKNLDGTDFNDKDGVYECRIVDKNPPPPPWA